MRKANKELLPQERFLNLLNDMVDIGWHPFGLYGRDYCFSHSNNPEFPYRLSYVKHGRAHNIDLTDYIIFSNEAGLIREILDNDMLDVHKFYNDIKPSIQTHYKKKPGPQYFDEGRAFTRSYFLQNQWDSSERLEIFFEYLIEE